jgi:glycosyltransferase involved in cell wall biosynthesis
MALPGARIAVITSTELPHGGGGISSAHFNLYRLLKASVQGEVRLFPYHSALPPITDLAVRVARQFCRRGLGWFDNAVAWECSDIVRGAAQGRSALSGLDDFEPDIVIAPDHGAPLLAIPKKTNTKWIVVSHHNPMRFLGVEGLEARSIHDAKLAVMLENRIYDRADSVVCPSLYMAQIFRTTYRTSAEVEVIPNLVDFEYLDSCEEESVARLLGLPDDAFVFYLPSLGSPIKGRSHADALLEVIAERYGNRPLGCYISGPVLSPAPSLRGLRVYMPGGLEYGKHLSLVRSCNVCISPTLVENFSMALIEAASFGIPVVAFDVGGTREWLVQGECGALVESGEVAGLASAAEPFVRMAGTTALRERVRDLTKAALNQDVILGKWITLISKIMDSDPAVSTTT